MKRSNILWGITGVLVLVVAGWTVMAALPEQKEIVRIGSERVLGGVTLKPGTYLVVHRDLGDKEGVEPCTFVYRGTFASEKDLAVKAICRRSDGPVARQFTMEATRQPDGTLIVRSIQFPGSTDVHNYDNGAR